MMKALRSSLLLQVTALGVVAALLLVLWPGLYPNLLVTKGYEPHGHCYFWQRDLLWLHNSSDILIGLSYVAISTSLVYLVLQARGAIPFRWLFVAFGVFIIACGATHFMEVLITYKPYYWLAGYVKLVTAVASVTTAIALPRIIPTILHILREARVSAERKRHLETANAELAALNAELANEVAERKRAESDLQILQERFYGIYESSKDAIGFADLDGRLVDVNSAFLSLTGYSRAEALTLNYASLTPTVVQGSREAYFEELNQTGQPTTYERDYTRKDGARIPIEVTSFVVKNESAETIGMAAIIKDITERRQSRQRLAQQALDLERSNRDLEQFAYVASHDLQEPLRKVNVLADLLERKWKDSLDEEGRDYLLRLRNSVTRMQTLILDLMSLSRISTRSNPFRPVELSRVVNEVLSDLEARMQQNNAQVTVGALPTIEADALQMRQLFQNLIGNSLKFQEEGAQPIIEVSAEIDRVNNECRIAVQDNGIGFDEKLLHKIVQPFQRLHTRTEYEGSGIGMAICQKVVERHGGKIEVRSQPGAGTTFFITLPLKQAQLI